MEENEKKNICYIVGAGELPFCRLNFRPQDGDLVIAADGGFDYLLSHNIVPDLIIGDFDSLNIAKGEFSQIKKIRYDTDKDETDMLLAVMEGIRQGYKEFRIYGGTGGSIRHTMANFQVLNYIARNDAIGFLFDKKEIITVISNAMLHFSKLHAGYVSVFAGTKASGIDIKSLKYELKSGTMSRAAPHGVSNKFLGKDATVSIKSGSLLIIFDYHGLIDVELTRF